MGTPMQSQVKRMDLIIFLAESQRMEIERDLARLSSERGQYDDALKCLRRLDEEIRDSKAAFETWKIGGGYDAHAVESVNKMLVQLGHIIKTQLKDTVEEQVYVNSNGDENQMEQMPSRPAALPPPSGMPSTPAVWSHSVATNSPAATQPSVFTSPSQLYNSPFNASPLPPRSQSGLPNFGVYSSHAGLQPSAHRVPPPQPPPQHLPNLRPSLQTNGIQPDGQSFSPQQQYPSSGASMPMPSIGPQSSGSPFPPQRGDHLADFHVTFTPARPQQPSASSLPPPQSQHQIPFMPTPAQSSLLQQQHPTRNSPFPPDPRLNSLVPPAGPPYQALTQPSSDNHPPAPLSILKPWPTADPTYSRPALEPVSFRPESAPTRRIPGDVSGAAYLRKQLDEQDRRAEENEVKQWHVQVGIGISRTNPLKRHGDKLEGGPPKRQDLGEGQLRGGGGDKSKRDWFKRTFFRKNSKSSAPTADNSAAAFGTTGSNAEPTNGGGSDSNEGKSLIKLSLLNTAFLSSDKRAREIHDALASLIAQSEATPARLPGRNPKVNSGHPTPRMRMRDLLEKFKKTSTGAFDTSDMRAVLDSVQEQIEQTSSYMTSTDEEETQKGITLSEQTDSICALENTLETQLRLISKVFVGGEPTAVAFAGWIGNMKERLTEELKFGERAGQMPYSIPPGRGERQIVYVV
ncbi:hypothetical protein Cob_v004230 [Colletotrichum orbiculare MAFF 240422]|uniref:Uncharacterized protein n=1 Tax=Colletotrichum orbiculare (strain 104-T / ATCC 96160 / CBS 514.97 / LARS 414 / MAFF 240422) TaxID=1213857 RepID=A0A484FZ25_COLOR|nr:hypothetical protein Cob_v004230 [Colletotrichum orbiculare MAFF 240422]